MTQIGIEEAKELLIKEWPNAVSIEITAEKKPDDRYMGVLLIQVNSYEEKKEIYEAYGEGEKLYPALFHGWEVRARKHRPSGADADDGGGMRYESSHFLTNMLYR